MANPPHKAHSKAAGDGKALAAVLGSVTAAALLFVAVPAEESGRQTEARVLVDGSIKTRHVKGRQYLKAYLDVVGVPTICDGITRINGVPIKMGSTATEQQCALLLEHELIAHAQGVLKCAPTLYGRTYQVFAAVSLAYNIGVGAFCKSTAARMFNAKQWVKGCNGILPYNKGRVKGQLRVIRGLDSRRKREHAICLKGL